MDALNKRLIHASVPILIIHSIEEFYLGLPVVDKYGAFVAEHIGLTNNITYFLEQLVLFTFLAVLLFFILLHKNIKYGAFIIGLMLVAELIHVLPALASGSYYPGLFSAVILVGLGMWYWCKVYILSRSS